jgi:hypothetical protein
MAIAKSPLHGDKSPCYRTTPDKSGFWSHTNPFDGALLRSPAIYGEAMASIGSDFTSAMIHL